MLKDFQKFIMRGNVVDLAVGVIIGAAFTTIVNSLVTDIIMPPLGLLLGGVDFSNFFVQISGDLTYATLQEAQAAHVVTINYGLFINAIIRFVIVAFAVYLMIRGINRLSTRLSMMEISTAPPANKQEQLLTEIRDLLKSK